jgi:type II secretion system protein H
MLRRNDNTPAFTLVELILVMAILATIMALALPSLSRSFRERNLGGEATRLLALTEYARDEAVSQGEPMVVWIDAKNAQFGVEVKTGYIGDSTRSKAYTLNSDIHFDAVKGDTIQGGGVRFAEFEPDGTADPTSIASARLTDRFASTLLVAKTADGWGYEIVKERR